MLDFLRLRLIEGSLYKHERSSFFRFNQTRMYMIANSFSDSCFYFVRSTGDIMVKAIFVTYFLGKCTVDREDNFPICFCLDDR